MSGIQGWCEADRCEGEHARCGNATGLRWFCGNPDDALTADQWVELGVYLMSEVSSGLRHTSRFVSACQCQNQERHGRKASLVRTPTMIPARFTFHVVMEMVASQGCMSLQSLGSLELNILKTFWNCSEQGRRLTEAVDTCR